MKSRAAKALSMCLLLFLGYILGLTTRLNIRAKYRYAVLDDSYKLVDEFTGQQVGVLNKNAVLFSPNILDMGVTDPGDRCLYKIYVRIPMSMVDRMIFLNGAAKSSGRTLHPMLRLSTVEESGGGVASRQATNTYTP